MNAKLRSWLTLFGAWFILNFVLTFHNIWPTLWITTRWELSMEMAALILLLGAWRRWVAVPGRRLLLGLTALVFVMMLGRYLEVTAPALFGRAVNLYWDAQYLPDVAAMLSEAYPAWVTVALIIGAILAVAAACWLIHAALKRISRAYAEPGVARPLAATMAVIVCLYFLGYHTPVPTLSWFSIPISQTYQRQAGFVLDAISGEAARAALPARSPLDELAAPNLPRQDVLLSFIESYGAIAYDSPTIDSAVTPHREGFATAAGNAGLNVVSAFIEAPTFGGGSWMSHISFLSGIRINDNGAYNLLLTQVRPTLPKLFRAAGYRSVALMPGLKGQWPEGDFYGFDTIYGEEALDYTGPEFGWWRIPDQYALARLRQLELEPGRSGRAPIFLFFPTISTHAPFKPTPPYQPQWDRMLGSEPYPPQLLGSALEETAEWADSQAAFGDAVGYTFDYWSGYLQAHGDEDFLLILLGDHQPPAFVSGPGARWDVPVHIVTGDAAMTERLLEFGFVSGMTPDPLAISEMHELALLLVE